MQKYPLITLFSLGMALFAVQQTYSQEATPAVAAQELPQLVVPQIPGVPEIPSAGLGTFRGPFRPENDPRIAAGMKEELTVQLRSISQLIGQIDPRDTQFLNDLRKEQTALIEQLKGLEQTAKGANETEAVLPSVQATNDSQPWGTEPLHPNEPVLPPNWQQMPPEELAKIFAEQQNRNRTVGQPGQMPPMLPRGFQGVQGAVPLGGAEVPGLGGGRAPMNEGFMPPAMGNPGGLPWGGQQQPSQEIAELKDTIAALKRQIEQMRSEVKALDTQMQLLNQNILLKMGNSK